MSIIAFDPEKAISRDLVERSRKELCSLVARICKNYVDRKIRKLDVEPMLSYDAEIQAEMESKD